MMHDDPQLTERFNQFREGNANPSLTHWWQRWLVDGRLEQNKFAVCYSVLKVPEKVHTVSVGIKVPFNRYKQEAPSFIRWLLSPICPWRPIIAAQQQVAQQLHPNPYTVPFIMEKGIFLPNMNVDAHLFINFLIGTRCWVEDHQMHMNWKLLTDHHVHPNIAYVVSHFFLKNDQNNITAHEIMNANHSAIHLHLTSYIPMLENFIYRRNLTLDYQYSENKSVGDSCNIWGCKKASFETMRSEAAKSSKFYFPTFMQDQAESKTVKKGAFSEETVTQWSINALVGQCKKWEQELGIYQEAIEYYESDKKRLP